MRRTGACIIFRELDVWVVKGVHTNYLSRHKESQYPSRGELYCLLLYRISIKVRGGLLCHKYIQSFQDVTLGF